MRLRDREMPLDPEIERELEAIDRALAGRSVDPDLEELGVLAAEIRDERPEPTAEVEAFLDGLAEDGFPPRESDSLGRASRRASDAFAALRRRGARRLVPAFGAAAVFAIAVGVGISESGIFAGGQGGAPPQTAKPIAVEDQAKPSSPTPSATAQSAPATGGTGSATDQFNAHLPRGNAAAAARSGALVRPAGRHQARNVDLELATAPDDFRGAADGVLDVVRDHHGFVVSSHVTGGDPAVKGAERGRASFDLRIPAGELSAAMGDLSDLGHVVSRTDGTHDITKRFVSDRKRIDDLTAARDRLLRQLGQATTIGERQSIRARLRILQAQLMATRKDLAKAQERVHLVPVGVEIVADENAAPSGGAWSIGDAFHDAGRVLTVTAGAALVGGAALLPFAILAALGVAAWRGWVRRQRSRALDATTPG
jgi:Domain of unknown function (DUF4349)